MRCLHLARILPLAVVLAQAACEVDSTNPVPGLDESEITFVPMSPNAPPLETMDTAFWAVRGEERELEIRYESPTYGLSKCMRFVVPADAVPAGVSPGDSVRITVQVVDPRRFIFSFEPASLRFDEAHPPRLEIRYTLADPDINQDGVVDERDARLAAAISIWSLDPTNDTWSPLETVVQEDVLEAQAPILGFSQFALASD